MSKSEEEDFERILSLTGGFGRYQITRLILLCFTSIPSALMLVSNIAAIMPPLHKCAIPPSNVLPPSLRNLSSAELEHLLIPLTFNEIHNKIISDQCLMRNYSELLEGAIVSNESLSNLSLINCPFGWTFEEGDKWSMISQWNLVCDNDIWGHLYLAFCAAGDIFGSLAIAILQDRIGRKLCLFTLLVWYSAFGALQALMRNIYAFIAMGFLRSFMDGSLCQLPGVLALEMVTNQHNTFVINFCGCVYTVSIAVGAGIAWAVYDFRDLIWIQCVFAMCCLGFWWVLDESPRWLHSVGKMERAGKVVERIARVNGVALEKAAVAKMLLNAAWEEEKRPETRNSLVTLLKTRNLCLIAVFLTFLFSTNEMVYVGLCQNAYGFGGNPYVVLILTCLVEIPPQLCNFVVNYVGRIFPCCIALTLSGSFLLVSSLVPQTSTALVIALVVAAKFCIGSSYSTVFQMSGELFPTCLRGTGMGLVGTVAQVIHVVTPFIVFTSYSMKTLPTLILGAMAMCAGFLTLFFPETLNRKLPDTIEDTQKYPGFGFRSFAENVTLKAVKRQRMKRTRNRV